MQIRYFLLLALLFLSVYSFAQKPEENIYNYDLVYMKDNSILKGEIIIFEEEDGDITFKDLKGKTYSITRDEYRYFKENVRYYENDDKIRIIKNRKINEFEVSVGFLPGLTLFENISPILPPDTRNAEFSVHNTILPLNVSLTLGKYFNRNHFVGVNGIYGVIYQNADLSSYLSGGLKYKYQYDPYKNNLALYVFGNANYTLIQGNFRDINVYTANSDFYADQIENTYKIQYPEIGVGHGFSWVLKNKKSISLELSVSRSLALNETVQTANTLVLIDANRSFSTAILGITFNL